MTSKNTTKKKRRAAILDKKRERRARRKTRSRDERSPYLTDYLVERHPEL